MMKIQGEEVWATIPINSREEFDDIPKYIVKDLVMSCARSYFYTHICDKDSKHELESIEPVGMKIISVKSLRQNGSQQNR